MEFQQWEHSVGGGQKGNHLSPPLFAGAALEVETMQVVEWFAESYKKFGCSLEFGQAPMGHERQKNSPPPLFLDSDFGTFGIWFVIQDYLGRLSETNFQT